MAKPVSQLEEGSNTRQIRSNNSRHKYATIFSYYTLHLKRRNTSQNEKTLISNLSDKTTILGLCLHMYKIV